MRKHCEEGFGRCKRFEQSLKEWGFADVNSHAVQIMPLDPAQLTARARDAKEAESALCKARHEYIKHLAHCLVCSRKLVSPSDSAFFAPDHSPFRPQLDDSNSSRTGFSSENLQDI